jgi:ABC-2 type transport system ATP-binding protein/ribosome-dependent ATPase
MTALAESLDVTKRFEDLVAVDRVSVRVGRGEVVGLLGANGAGKTTLIRLLLGLERASGGEVRLFGESPSRRTRRRLGYVPQGLGLYDDLTPVENLAFARSVFGEGTTTLPSSIAAFANLPIGSVPLGVQRRVAFVEALAHDPELLVLDEPTSGVDPLARTRLWETIHDAADRNAGVLVTTHHMEEAEECDRLVVMADGVVVVEGTVAQIVGDARVAVVEAGRWAAAFDAVERAGMRVALVGTSLRVPGVSAAEVRDALRDVPANVDEAPATLEERFLELTRSRERI